MARVSAELTYYLVSVRDMANGRRLALVRCPIGQWAEIGFWLDDRGYIKRHYRVAVHPIFGGQYVAVPLMHKED